MNALQVSRLPCPSTPHQPAHLPNCCLHRALKRFKMLDSQNQAPSLTSTFPPLPQAPRPPLPSLPSSVMADPDLGNLVSERIPPPESDTNTDAKSTLDRPQPSIPRFIKPIPPVLTPGPPVSAPGPPVKDHGTQTGSSAEGEDDLGPATFRSNGSHDNDNVYNHFNQERQRFWEDHFPVSHEGDDALYLDSFLRTWRQMWRHYRPELVFATEFSDSQDTAGRSEAQVHGIIAAAWPKSLPLFHEFWNMDNHREANSTQAFQSHLKICSYDPRQRPSMAMLDPWMVKPRFVRTSVPAFPTIFFC